MWRGSKESRKTPPKIAVGDSFKEKEVMALR